MTHRELLAQALTALIHHTEQTRPIERTDDAITAIRKALAVPDAEPAVPGDMVMVPREPTPEMLPDAWREASGRCDHETLRRVYRAMIAAAPAQLAAREPLTKEQMRAMWRSSDFRGNGGQIDWFCEGLRAAEKHHGIHGSGK